MWAKERRAFQRGCGREDLRLREERGRKPHTARSDPRRRAWDALLAAEPHAHAETTSEHRRCRHDVTADCRASEAADCAGANLDGYKYGAGRSCTQTSSRSRTQG